MIEIVRKNGVWRAVDRQTFGQPGSGTYGLEWDIEAIRFSGEDLRLAIEQFCGAVPLPTRFHTLGPVLDMLSLEDVRITWFGDHARFIVANWRAS